MFKIDSFKLLGIALAIEFSPTPCHSLTLTEAVHIGWERAPQLEAQDRQHEVSSGDRWRRFVPNSPQVQYANTDDGSAESIGLSETFAFPGRALASMQLDRAHEESQRAEWRAKKYEIAQIAISAYLDNASFQAQIEDQKKSVLEQEKLAKTLRARYETGLGAQAQEDSILADLQLSQARADLSALEDKAHVSSHKLFNLLHISIVEGDQSVIPDDLDPGIVAELGAQTADEARGHAALALAKANGALALWNQLPDLSVGITKNHYFNLPASPSGNVEAYNYGASLTVPLFFPFHEKVESERAKNQSVIDASTAEAQLRGADADKEDAALEYRRSQTRLKELRDRDLPQALSLQKSARSLYQAGKLGFADLILARQTLASLRAQEIQVRISIISSHLRSLHGGVGEGEIHD